jgi:hypothetical protein
MSLNMRTALPFGLVGRAKYVVTGGVSIVY